MKNKKHLQKTRILIVALLLILSASLVYAADESKPIAGYIKIFNGDDAYNATVIIKANVGKNNDLCDLYQSDPINFAEFEKYCNGCSCSTSQTFSYNNGIYVENLGNLVHDGVCSITSENAGDECGDDWSERPENTVWAEIFGSTINPSQGNGSTSPVLIMAGGGTQWLENITLPAGLDLPPEIVGISPDGWVSDSPIVLNVETNEYATCKYSTTSKSYAEKEHTFDGNTRYHNLSIILSSGANNFYIQCQDESSQLSDEVLQTISLDTQTPATTDNFDGLWHNENIDVTLSPDCGLSGCDWTKYCLGSACTPSLDYTAPITMTDYDTLKYHSQDNAGNIEAVKTTEIKIDKEDPTTFDNYGGGTFNYDIYVTITSVCGLSSCEWTKYCVGSYSCTPDTDYTGAILFTESTYLRYRSKDFAGNTQSIQTTQISIDKGAAPSGGGGRAAERYYPGELVEEIEEIPEIIPEPVPSFTPPVEEKPNITLPPETVVPEVEIEKVRLWWCIPLILLLLLIIILLLLKRRKKEEEPLKKA
jgi:hypothetical protein